MAKKQPLYPHVPKRSQSPITTGARTRTDLRFFPDSVEEISYTTKTIGYEAKLAQAFQQAIARAKGLP